MARYEIDKDNAVLVWYDDILEAPALYQPFDPEGDGTPFASKTAAKAWAEAHVAAVAAVEAAAAAEAVTPTPEEPIS